MSLNLTDSKEATQPAQVQAEKTAHGADVPKKILPAQTVCNEKNEKGKLCSGHLKQLRTAGEEAAKHLRGDDVLYKCQTCGRLYMGPPMGHVRDPQKQSRFIERDLAAILQAAGGTLPYFNRPTNNAHAPAAAPSAPAAAPAAPPQSPATARSASDSAPAGETPAEKRARLIAEAKERAARLRAEKQAASEVGPPPSKASE